jgi:hypothetical protein
MFLLDWIMGLIHGKYYKEAKRDLNKRRRR